MIKIRSQLFFLIIVLLLAACNTKETPTPEPSVGIANPASVFCEENGGALELRTDDTGAGVGYCVFPDKSECEEWSYFRGECKPGDSLPAN